jgi:hypothetical protein
VTTTALTPPQALGLLSALCTDIQAAAVLDDRGELLAGAPDLAAVASDPQAPTDPARLVARSAHHTIVVAVGPRVLRSVLEIDLQTALDAMAPPG